MFLLLLKNIIRDGYNITRCDVQTSLLKSLTDSAGGDFLAVFKMAAGELPCSFAKSV